MNRTRKAIAYSLLVLTLAGGTVFAQGPPPGRPQQGPPQHYDNNRYVQHKDWKKGRRMRAEDWRRGDRISDYQRYRLRRPPRGYEWRRVDGNFVLAAVATGLIASIIAASTAQ